MTIQSLLRAVEGVHELDPSMSVQTLLVYLETVRRHPAPTVARDVADRYGLDTSSVARHYHLLGDRGRQAKLGRRWVCSEPSSDDRRVIHRYLSVDGLRVARRLGLIEAHR